MNFHTIFIENGTSLQPQTLLEPEPCWSFGGDADNDIGEQINSSIDISVDNIYRCIRIFYSSTLNFIV